MASAPAMAHDRDDDRYCRDSYRGDRYYGSGYGYRYYKRYYRSEGG